MDTNEISVQNYDLSGGSKVAVHKMFGNDYYIAIVDSQGIYPESGNQARNFHRQEYIVILSGEFSCKLNGEVHKLSVDDSILVDDGDTYQLNGVGKVLVFVHDLADGKTEIVPE